MKIKLLGTGSSYSVSNCSSLIIDEKILIDAGPGLVKQLIKDKFDFTKIETVLITHLHSDHILDFFQYILMINYLRIEHVVNVYMPKNTREKIKGMFKILYEDYYDDFISKKINFIEISNNDEINFDNYNIKVKEVIHTGINSYGFIINNKLGITGDTMLCDSVEEIVRSSKLIICDCSMMVGDIYHMGIDNIEYLHNKYLDKTLVGTHFRDDTREKLRELNYKNVIIGEDCLELEV